MMFDDSDNIYDDFPESFDGSENESYIAEREKSLDDFRERLLDGETRFDFDEDQWITLIDYADDSGDKYVFHEAMWRSLTAFPDSDALNDRRLLGLFDTLDDEELCLAFRVALAAEHPSRFVRMQNAYFDWTKLPDEQQTSDDGYRRLCDIVFDGDRIPDFDIIESVRIIADMQALQLMADDLERWEKKCYNPEMLWYEVVNTAIDNSLWNIALPVVEKLISRFPYNPVYWNFKARILVGLAVVTPVESVEVTLEKMDEIMSTVDTVLAIKPDDLLGLTLKNRLERLREGLMKSISPGESNQADISAYALARQASDPMAYEDLVEFFEAATPKALDKIREWVRFQLELIEKDDENEDDILNYYPNFYNYIETLYIGGHNDSADVMLAIVDEFATEEHPALYPLRIVRLIEKGEIEKVPRLLDKISQTRGRFPFNPTRILLTACLKTEEGFPGEVTELLDFLDRELVFNNDIDDESMQQIVGYINPAVLHFILRRYLKRK